MATPDTSAPSETPVRYWARVLRPLMWWLLLVLVLYGIRTHQRLMANTRLKFTVSVNGRTDYFPPNVTFDGQHAFSDQLISLGNHRFSVTHPKGVAYFTNLFIWYGGHDFGNIDLPRATGNLSVSADPPAPRLIIRGPEFTVTLTNSSGISQAVPTDQYTVEAHYRHWDYNQQVLVNANVPNSLAIGPRFGGLELLCYQDDATFQLLGGNDEVLDSGSFPARIGELPVGIYKLVAWRHNRRWEEKAAVNYGTTNKIHVEFKYGSAILETRPSGASVTGSDGHYWGVTPLKLTELQPGIWNFLLRLDNYESLTASLVIAANETTTVSTNLTSQSYTGALRAARQYMNSANYDRAIESLGDVLRTQPDDSAAGSLVREATGLRSIQRAEALGQQGNYIAGGVELKTALTYLPDNEKARRMVADFQQHEPEQIERTRLERFALPKNNFDEVVSKISGANLFKSYELTTSKPAGDVLSAIVAQLRAAQPAFRIDKSDIKSATEIFGIEATQVFPGGSRRCVIVGGKSKDDETRIYFTVVESKKVGFMEQPITSLVGATPMEYTQINPTETLSDKLQNQIADGVATVTALIQVAIGQTPPPAAPSFSP